MYNTEGGPRDSVNPSNILSLANLCSQGNLEVLVQNRVLFCSSWETNCTCHTGGGEEIKTMLHIHIIETILCIQRIPKEHLENEQPKRQRNTENHKTQRHQKNQTKLVSSGFSLPCGPFSLIPEVTEKLLCLFLRSWCARLS